MLSSPSSVITMISPGSISRINFAPIISSAQVSEANTGEPAAAESSQRSFGSGKASNSAGNQAPK